MPKCLRILITAGPTHEPIDPVRYIGNRSSGQMGAALAEAALARGHQPTLILGPVTAPMPQGLRRIDVETARQMQEAVLREFAQNDLLIMAAAVADYRPRQVRSEKIGRKDRLVLELEATEDIVAAASAIKGPDQRVIGFSLESAGNVERARGKLHRKKLDLIVYNPTDTMNSPTVEAVLVFPDGHIEQLPCRSKRQFADNLITRAEALWG